MFELDYPNSPPVRIHSPEDLILKIQAMTDAQWQSGSGTACLICRDIDPNTGLEKSNWTSIIKHPNENQYMLVHSHPQAAGQDEWVYAPDTRYSRTVEVWIGGDPVYYPVQFFHPLQTLRPVLAGLIHTASVAPNSNWVLLHLQQWPEP